MHSTITRLLSAASFPAALAPLLVGLVLLFGAGTATAETIASGPVLLIGYSPDEDAAGVGRDLVLASVGWRWSFDGADAIDDFLAKGRIDFSWAVEPLLGGVFGDSDAFEASLVPYARFAPLGMDGVVPWLDLGIGVAYTTLRGYALGSRVEFSDNVGVGVTIGSGEGLHWSIGYRFRHLSHLGIFGDDNEGLNAHFLTFSVE